MTKPKDEDKMPCEIYNRENIRSYEFLVQPKLHSFRPKRKIIRRRLRFFVGKEKSKNRAEKKREHNEKKRTAPRLDDEVDEDVRLQSFHRYRFLSHQHPRRHLSKINKSNRFSSIKH